jgi:hypothetical protein
MSIKHSAVARAPELLSTSASSEFTDKSTFSGTNSPMLSTVATSVQPSLRESTNHINLAQVLSSKDTAHNIFRASFNTYMQSTPLNHVSSTTQPIVFNIPGASLLRYHLNVS